MTTPWLSVIVPTCNGEAYLASTLASIASQAAPDIEVVAVDDGSSDATLSMLQSYADRLQLRVFARRRLGNWVASTNFGLAQATGKYACFLHQDDTWLPGRIGKMRRLVADHPQAALFLHPCRYIDGQGRALGCWRSPLQAGPSSAATVVERLLVQNFIAVPAPLFEREAALRGGGLDETLWYTADWDFWLRLAAKGTTVYHPEVLAAFRVHPLSQTARGVARDGEMRQQIENALAKHLPAWEAAHPGRKDVSQAARMSLEVNHALAGCAHGRVPNLLSLTRHGLALGRAGWYRFLRDSRIVERVAARLKARIVA